MRIDEALDARFAALEQRVETAEATAAILRLMAAYGPAIDSGSVDTVVGLWSADGIYDVERFTATGAAALRKFAEQVSSESDQELAHFLGLPQISVNGDRAVGLCHSLLFRVVAGSFELVRVAANRWDFVRGLEGWRVVRRINRALEEGGRALFADAMMEEP